MSAVALVVVIDNNSINSRRSRGSPRRRLRHQSICVF